MFLFFTGRGEMSGAEYMLSHNGQQFGPHSHDEITSMLQAGMIDDSAFVYNDGWSEWLPVSALVRTPTTPMPIPPALPRSSPKPRRNSLFSQQGRNLAFGVIGTAIGAVAAVPVSYFFQPGLMRAFVGLGNYVWFVIDSMPGDIFSAMIGEHPASSAPPTDLAQTVLAAHSMELVPTVLASVIILGCCGFCIGRWISIRPPHRRN
jgi:hypothetical protein